MVSLIQVCWVHQFILLIFCDCYFLNIPVSSRQFRFSTEWMQRCTNYTGGIPQGPSVVQNALWFPCAAEPTQSNLSGQKPTLYWSTLFQEPVGQKTACTWRKTTHLMKTSDPGTLLILQDPVFWTLKKKKLNKIYPFKIHTSWDIFFRHSTCTQIRWISWSGFCIET